MLQEEEMPTSPGIRIYKAAAVALCGSL
uniref:Uncharacterized protein n=1 Tax=Rhizophora mucronata TaxID=61149 RepID=A0A2P2Q988_RHIMU